MKKENNYKVYQLDNKNQFIIDLGDKLIFQSYNNVVAIYRTKNHPRGEMLTLGRYWDYSKTTMKHLYIFINRYINNYELCGELNTSKNKRAYLIKLIENSEIEYNDNLI